MTNRGMTMPMQPDLCSGISPWSSAMRDGLAACASDLNVPTPLQTCPPANLSIPSVHTEMSFSCSAMRCSDVMRSR